MRREKNTLSRRTFLAGSSAGMASVGCLGFSTKSFPEIFTNDQDTVVEAKIITRTLGSTGIQVPIVNMGVMNSMDPALVKSAFKKGVRYFDTAAWYQRGGNEKMLGQAVQDLKARDRVILGTKVYIPHQQRSMRPEKAKEEYIRIANESLERLQIDYVDILYSHNVSTLEWLNNPGIIEALKLLKKEGKTRFIGFTTYSNMTECIQSAVQNREYDVIATAYTGSIYPGESML
jgi:aryl-alcohol dehydrogenase-like predicted oxidoreductase